MRSVRAVEQPERERADLERARTLDPREPVIALAHPGRLEAFGLGILEARAAGVPVVAMASGGVSDLVEHRRNGLLAQTPSEFSEAVAEMMSDSTLRRRLADEATRGLEEYDWNRVALKHESAYAKASGLEVKQERSQGEKFLAYVRHRATSWTDLRDVGRKSLKLKCVPGNRQSPMGEP